MHIRFADVDESFIKNEVSGGFYSNETELVRDAVRRLREEKERTNRFRAAVMRGVEDIEAGRTSPLTREFMDSLVEDGIARAENNKPYYSNDAVPDNEQN